MAPAEQNAGPAGISIHTPDGKVTFVPFDRDRLRLGRAESSELCYRGVTGLSREHAVFEREGTDWMVRDLGSTNGTLVNGVRIQGRSPLHAGDRLQFGQLTAVFRDRAEPDGASVVFVDDHADPSASITMTASLGGLLGEGGEAPSAKRMQALVRAGRELAGHMSLAQLFDLILDLSVEAVGAARGVLMTLEGRELRTRSIKGAGFRISSFVRDLVIDERRSLLVRDALADQALAARMSIVQQHIRSMLAAPLQTDDRVIGLIYLDSPDLIHEFTEEDLSVLTVMANIAAIRIEQARLVEVEQAEKLHAKELEHAALIQRSILPAIFPPFPDRKDFELHAAMAPAREVGGDFFDFFFLDTDRLGFVVGDVSGKGVPAALFMAVTRTLLRATAQHIASPAECLTYVNNTLIEQNVSRMFVTLFYGVLDMRSGEIQFANAGHNPPYLLSPQGVRALRDRSGPMLGVIEGVAYAARTCRIEPGESIVLYTDGVTEATDPDRNFFEEHRLERFLAGGPGDAVERLVAGLVTAAQSFSGGLPQADDITVLALRYFG
jgi:sigma-B regulation protein RsbU (phosphoserine phosphatase)